MGSVITPNRIEKGRLLELHMGHNNERDGKGVGEQCCKLSPFTNYELLAIIIMSTEERIHKASHHLP
jgi:hypothetical protein